MLKKRSTTPKAPVLRLKDAVLTYRYLRVTMLAMLVMLGVSVVWFALDAKCGLDSVSAYYYTPVRNVFVGALVAFGAALFAYHGPTREEEALLNLAGCMSLVVAFVPTVPATCAVAPGVDGASSGVDAVADASGQDPTVLVNMVDEAVTNNVRSLITAALVAFALFAVLKFAARSKKVEGASVADDATATWWRKYGRRPLLMVCLAIPAGGVIAFVGWPEWFVEKAHGFSAIVLVGALILYMVFNATLSEHLTKYRLIYVVLAGVVSLALAVILGIAWTVSFNRAIFYLEFVILGIFAVYWMVQSIELRGQTAAVQQ